MNNEKSSSKRSKKEPTVGKALLFLLIIPIQFVLDLLIVYVGVFIDMAYANQRPDVVGHAAPIFSGLAVVLSIILTVIAIIVSIVLTIVYFVKAHRSRQ